MKVMITNDDGVNSAGILAAKDALSQLNNEYISEINIVAPETQQSGVGRSITLTNPLHINKVKLADGFEAYSVSGTPADSTLLGFHEIMKKDLDLVISGINIGENLGKMDISASGTFGAAVEAASNGIPAIAISLQILRKSSDFKEGHGLGTSIDFTFAKKILQDVSKKVIKKGLPKGADLLNINIPAVPANEELKLCELGDKMFNLEIKKNLDLKDKPYYWIGGVSAENGIPGTDIHTLRVLNQATMTPISLDCTGDMNSISDW
ncbi:MAG: 5'/3'-nucleotidase SurE [Methanobacteriaceae archaeon]